MNLYTIGFAKKRAEEFFNALIKSGVKKIIDIRLNNVSQLAGYTKKCDLEFFLSKIGNIKYVHMSIFAPSRELLDSYRKRKITWEEYEKKYFDLLDKRNTLKEIDYSLFVDSCLLCSENRADKCHRRLLAEYLKKHNPQINIIHL